MQKIFHHGEAEFTVASGEKVAIYSESKASLFKQVVVPSLATRWVHIYTTDEWENWTSSAFSLNSTICRIQAQESDVYFEVGVAPTVGTEVAWGSITGTLSSQADLESRFSTIEDTNVYYEIYQSIGSGTDGTVTKPTGSTILLNKYPGAADCVLVSVDGSGIPTDEAPRTAGGAVVTSTLDIAGVYAFSGVPSVYPVALVYFIQIPFSLNGNVDQTTLIQKWAVLEASDIKFTPAGGIAAVQVQTAIEELDTEKLSTVAVTSPMTGAGTAGSPLVVPVFVGSGASHAPGLVPDPGVTPGTTKFLREDGTFIAPVGGSGTVTSVTAGAGMTQSGDPAVNPTLDVVSHAGTAGSVGTLVVVADSVGVSLGATSTTACSGADARLSDARTPINDASLVHLTGTESITGAKTFSSARINPRISTTASSATPTPNADTDEMYTVTALAVGATFGAPTGTPVNGQKLLIRIKDNATARSLAWNAAYVAGGVALPTTTVLSKILTVGFMYNTDNSLNKWMCIASAQEA